MFPVGGRRENTAFPIAKPFPRIVISSESEKSFSFAVRKSCEGSGERETPCFMRLGSTVFHADGFTKENGNGKRKRSLGCARDDETGEAYLTFFLSPQRKPTSAPSGHLLPEEGGRMPPFLWQSLFPVSSFRAKARNLFRLRLGKGCEECGEREACFMRFGSTVFHADGFTKENGNGKRKRSLGCARDDETGRYISHSFSIHSGSRLLLAFPIGEGGPRQRWIGCSR